MSLKYFLLGLVLFLSILTIRVIREPHKRSVRISNPPAIKTVNWHDDQYFILGEDSIRYRIIGTFIYVAKPYKIYIHTTNDDQLEYIRFYKKLDSSSEYKIIGLRYFNIEIKGLKGI